MSIRTLLTRTGRLAVGTALGLALAGGVLASPARAAAVVAAPSPTAQPAGVPGLWVVRDADSTIYLFGTVHVLRPTTTWRTAKVQAAFDASSDLWLEVANVDDQAAALPLMQRYGLSPQTPLSTRLTPEELATLDAAARTVGASAQAFDPMRPWLAGLTLSVAPLLKAGYAADSGVDMILKAQATAAGKPVHGLETLEQQLRFFADMPPETELAFLRSVLRDFGTATTQLDQLSDAWAAGDTAGIEHLGVDEMRRQSASLYALLLADRNADWAGQIQHMLEGSGTAFIAVGAAHLAGPDSVQAQLERRGIPVTREQ